MCNRTASRFTRGFRPERVSRFPLSKGILEDLNPSRVRRNSTDCREVTNTCECTLSSRKQLLKLKPSGRFVSGFWDSDPVDNSSGFTVSLTARFNSVTSKGSHIFLCADCWNFIKCYQTFFDSSSLSSPCQLGFCPSVSRCTFSLSALWWLFPLIKHFLIIPTKTEITFLESIDLVLFYLIWLLTVFYCLFNFISFQAICFP